MYYAKESFTKKKILWMKKLYRDLFDEMEAKINNHSYSFSHEHLKYQTALSKQFWSLKNKG